MDIIKRADAKAQGLKRYYTGKPCKRGHIEERLTSTGDCLVCIKDRERVRQTTDLVKESRKKYYEQNRERILERQKQYNIDHADSIAEYQAKYRERTTEDRLQYHKDYYQQNKERLKLESREYYYNNIEQYVEYNLWYYQEHAEQLKSYQQEYYQRNKEQILLDKRKYYVDRKSEFIARNAKRRAAKKQATPPWAEFDQIRELYEECARLTDETGITYHVDHIVPLNHPLVCGLHCMANLQILSATDNMQKGNRFEV